MVDGGTPQTRAAKVNWAGNHTYRAGTIHEPASIDELQDFVRRSPAIRALGTRHAFNDVTDSRGDLVSLRRLPRRLEIDKTEATVTIDGGLTYGELCGALDAAGLALHNLASLPHISIAGAIATATHGSGDANGNLATAVRAVELVTSDGDVLTVARGEPDFDGVVVGLGALGVVTRVTLAGEPAYEVRQRVFEGLSWDALHEHFDEITDGGYSVSVFTRWGQTVDQVWIKSRVTDAPEREREELFGAVAATVDRHPILGLDAVNCTPQLGVAGPWSDRLPHFRMGFTPSAGEEIQSEYLLPREHALAAIDAVRQRADRIAPLLQVCEIRTIAADDLWMSTAYGRDSVAVHFTWTKEPAAVEEVLADLEPALAPLGARPHWGKLFLARAEQIAPLYERYADFVDLVQRLDPRGAFRNDWLERHVLGAR
jgi:xylitol oxidase